MKRDIDDVIVLGSGLSISRLNKQELDYINRCKVVIALNKFMAFYKEAKIMPTHIYFVDRHENSLNFLKYIFQVCKDDNLENLTFILHKDLKYRIYSNTFKLFANFLFYFAYNLKLLFLRSEKKNFKQLFRTEFYFKIKPVHNYQFITVSKWLEGGAWSNSLSEKLFHYRGSLTTVLNYVSICFPKRKVLLVGNDFNGSEYFFQNELDALDVEWQDFTTNIVKESGVHFSFLDFKGKKVTDSFPFILNKLEQSENELICVNKDSLLVTEANVKYAPLL